MKDHKILKSFKGSQDGRFVEEFVAGTVRPLSASLAKSAIEAGEAAPIETKAAGSAEDDTPLGQALAGLKKQSSKNKIADYVKGITEVQLDTALTKAQLLVEGEAALKQHFESQEA